MQDERLAQVVEGLKRALSPEVLRRMGKGSGLVRRSRCITAERLVPSLLRSLGSRKVASLAELARDFDADHETEIFYKPFYERLDAAGFPCLMQALFSRMVSVFRLPALQSANDGVLREFDDVWIQDGTSFALHPALRNRVALRLLGDLDRIEPLHAVHRSTKAEVQDTLEKAEQE